MRIALVVAMLVCGCAGVPPQTAGPSIPTPPNIFGLPGVSGQDRAEARRDGKGNGALSLEMAGPDGGLADIAKVQECSKSAGLGARDSEFSNRPLAPDERVQISEFAGIYRRMASFYECLDRLGYTMRARMGPPR